MTFRPPWYREMTHGLSHLSVHLILAYLTEFFRVLSTLQNVYPIIILGIIICDALPERETAFWCWFDALACITVRV